MADSHGPAEPDPVIEAYKPGIDRTLLRENLRLSVTERFEQLAALARMADELRRGRLQPEAGKATLLDTRKEVERGWQAVSELLLAEGRPELAAQVRRFAAQMPPPKTDREQIADALGQHIRAARLREPPTR